MKIDVIDKVQLKKGCVIWEGSKYKLDEGAWASYVPEIGAKILHSVFGYVHCTHKTAPSRRDLFEKGAGLKNDRYTLDEWVSVFSKSVLLRTAENYIVAELLYQSGIGPRVNGLFVVLNYFSSYNAVPSSTAGLYIDDLRSYPKKEGTTLEEIHNAGVIPDKIKSCYRQQINGYVSDLNSVVGAMPNGYENEVGYIYAELKRTYKANLARL